MATRILSWNVNGLRAVAKNGFMEWLAKDGPDILCLQETRVHSDELPPELRAPKGYTSYWMSGKKKGYAGTAAYVKKAPLSVSALGNAEFDDEGRVQILEYPKFVVINAYFPNSQPERRRLDYKLRFVDAMKGLCNKLVKQGKNVVVCGDYNIAHTEIDLARPKQNENNPGYLPEEREAMTQFLKAGYLDTFRHFCKEPGHYSWWSRRTNAREKNVGWRIDYHCVNKDFIGQVKRAAILKDVMGSDHCPVEVVLK